MRYGIFDLTSCYDISKTVILDMDDIVNNIDLFDYKQLRMLAGDHFIPNRSKMKKDELKVAVVAAYKNTDHGADNLDGLFLESGYDDYAKKNYPIMTVEEYLKYLKE